MPSEVAEVVASPLEVWVSPVGTAMPALTATTIPSPWKLVGTNGALNINDPGCTITIGQTQQGFFSSGGLTPRKKWRTEETMMIAFELVDLSPVQLALVLDEAAVSGTTTQSVQIKRGIKVHFYAMLLKGVSPLNEAKKCQFEVSSCCQSGNPAPKFSLKQGPAVLALQFDVLEIEAGKWCIFRAEE